jgi:hypothetical protein
MVFSKGNCHIIDNGGLKNADMKAYKQIIDNDANYREVPMKNEISIQTQDNKSIVIRNDTFCCIHQATAVYYKLKELQIESPDKLMEHFNGYLKNQENSIRPVSPAAQR